MLVEERSIETIRPYDKNPRHNDEGVDAVAASIQGEEQWLPVPGYEGLYEVSSYGRVRRSSKSRMAPAGYLLKGRFTWDGYLEYGLCKQQRYWWVKAHRIVALAFLGPRPFPNAHVAHFDGNKTNNHVSNLRWATPAENEADKKRHGRHRAGPCGERHHMAKLTPEQVKEMRRAALAGRTVKAIASLFGIPMLTAYDAIVGKTWRTVTEPPPVRLRRRKKA
jgi:hypothetical protein